MADANAYIRPSRHAKGKALSRPSYGHARTFIFTVALFALFVFIRQIKPPRSTPIVLARRELAWLTNATTTPGKCELVHQAADKCAFVRRNCADEQAGLVDYLDLYYCRMSHARPTALFIMVLWLGLLFSTIGIAASDFFCINLSTISSVLGISESMAGVTFLAFGNGSPDVFSTFAAMKTHNGSLAIGELIGAASFITAVVAGSMAIVRPFNVARKSFLRDLGFFIVAASFSLVFLADGHLHFWECAVMVGFYVFYVLFVMVWHWYLHRRSHRRIRENAARGEFQAIEQSLGDEVAEPFHDYDEEDGGTRTPCLHSRRSSYADFAALDRAGSPIPEIAVDPADDDSDETRERYIAEISNNMRLSRGTRSRRNTLTPIRPSLVGALEFRAVLSSLQQSRNVQSIPIDLIRRYSDDPNFTSIQQQDSANNTSATPSIYLEGPSRVAATPFIDRPRPDQHRVRAISANGVAGLHLNPHVLKPTTQVPSADNTVDKGPQSKASQLSLFVDSPPNITLSPASSSPPLILHDRSLAPQHFFAQQGDTPAQLVASPSTMHVDDPMAIYPLPRQMSLSRQLSVRTLSSSPASPVQSPVGDMHHSLPKSDLRQTAERGLASHQSWTWWPSTLLPSPEVLVATLFPTLYSWKHKSVWEKLLGVIAAPSVFLLVITLPTVEEEAQLRQEQEDSHGHFVENTKAIASPSLEASSTSPILATTHLIPPVGCDTANPIHLGRSRVDSMSTKAAKPALIPSSDLEPVEWNRWLVGLQLLTAPWFVVLLFWANSSDREPHVLLLNTLYSLTASFLALALLLVATSATQAPRYRHLLCYLGFVVAIAWISTIANEVVGVLKALGTILNISDAILGLTIFAMGNSLGDLVANITVSRLGYPVMALSACFGGPMLNILMGIGISGGYMTLRGANKREHRHPHKPLTFKPYQIEVGGTLLISGISLLLTLAALVIIVPLRGWKMDRFMGILLIAFWTLGTFVNILAELTGWSRKVGDT